MKNIFLFFAVLLFFTPNVGLSQSASCANQASRSELAKLQANLREGDLIFISSSSGQSDMLQEATDSIWTHVGVLMKKDNVWGVYEASSKMKWTPLKDFVAKSRSQQFSVKRVNEEVCENLKSADQNSHIKCNVQENIEALKKNLKVMVGSPYDVRFQWDDENLYCSEVTQKAYLRTFGIKIGTDQKLGDMLKVPEGKTWKDLPADSLVRKAIIDRFNNGEDFDPQVTAVSPVSQYNSKLLQHVHHCEIGSDGKPQVGKPAATRTGSR